MASRENYARICHLYILWMCLPSCGYATWMYLGISSVASREHETCSRIPGLVLKQLEICRDQPNAIFCVGMGARRGFVECQRQFRHERWNCTYMTNQSIFGPILQRGSKETAFIYAITSAGVVHAVTQACSSGNLTDCSCDLGRKPKPQKGQTWKWGGCSDDVKYGVSFGRSFVDATEVNEVIKGEKSKKRTDARYRMNLHNNEVGRQVVRESMKKKCRCHGVSGSCTVQTCWLSLPSFHEVGLKLRERYNRAVIVASRAKRKLRRREKRLRKVPVGEKDMVYMSRSPSYCRRDLKRGLLGTRGRECNRTPGSQGSCDLLCCGRGYNTRVVRHVERCYCKFYWCCQVKCKLCETLMDRYTCK